MKIVIASANPVKIKAVKTVLQPLYPQAKFTHRQTASQVPRQPLTDQQTRQGAINRAQASLQQTQADLAVGIEGGVMSTSVGMFATAWAAIIDSQGKLGLGGGLHFLLPKKIAVAINQGKELGPIMDKLTNRKNVKQQGGAVEVLTKGLITRTQGYIRLVELALAKFRYPEIYS